MSSCDLCRFLGTQSLRRPANLLGDADGAESGSDYGDWENDDWSVDSFAPPSYSTSKASQNMPPSKKVCGFIMLKSSKFFVN